ncbi:efflux RND transporter permease subunit [Gallaecimonas kandeliae]|uniref:efflux RND transporter permease subunit n=1 Tax=Gallaecimonas kandeliae TaxID=3029055 RepID=UPI0026489678|nr:efflux RND transporter permease subunit [Gallaecimonas kandeliae]WKE67063.1 efflux RND transporter permease subunit [Gallaecimonas kandeliae]
MNNAAARLARASLKRPVTVLMLSLSMLVMGVLASRWLQLEMWPGIEIPEITIQVPYANATPQEVEDNITRPIEEALATLSGVKEMRSWSNSDGANVDLQFDWATNVNAKSIEAREKLDSIRDLLPRDVQRVFVFQFSTNDMPVLTLRLSGKTDFSTAYMMLERELKRPLERLPGVSKVNLYGVDKPQLKIDLRAEQLIAMGLSPAKVAEKLQAANFQLAAGNIYGATQQWLVHPNGTWTDPAEVGRLYLTPAVQLKDVANISVGEPERREGRHFDQTYAVGLDVFKESSANLVDVASEVLKVVDEAKTNPALSGVRLFVMENQAESVQDSLHGLMQSGLIGAALSALVLFAFLRRFAMTAVVVLSVPFAICLTLAAMYFLGLSLNILSMMGLMLAVGMLVDNAVVVVESIATERANGLAGEEAVTQGVNRVALAMAAGTLTTAIVFLPNLFGAKVDITVFLKHVAVAICISLAASLLLAITLIPLLTKRFSGRAPASPATPKRYMKALGWVLQRPVRAWVGFILLAASTALPLSQLPSDDNFDGNDERLFISMPLPGEFPLAMVESEVTKMETYLYAHKKELGITGVYSYYAPNEATLTLLLKKPAVLPRDELKKRLREHWPKTALARPQFGFSDGKNGGVQLTLQGPSSERLRILAESLVPQLATIKGLKDVRADQDALAREIRIHPDSDRARQLGLTASDIADQVGLALRGQPARTLRNDDGETDVSLYSDHGARYNLAMLKRLPVGEAGGQLVRLEQVAQIEESPQVGAIQRYNRQTTVTIGANLEKLPLSEAREKITEMMDQVALPAGYRWSLDGRFKTQDEGQQVMATNMLLALAMIYLVMAALFESVLMPLAIVTAIGYSMTGAFWAFWLTQTPMSVMGMIGLLILMGIVVNNGIVLVDRINQLQGTGPLQEVILKACGERLRPILMTVATTVLGLVPLALGSTRVGGGGPSYAPMAIAIIGGLLLSTLVSLFLVPLCYQSLTGLKRRWRQVSLAAKLRLGLA